MTNDDLLFVSKDIDECIPKPLEDDNYKRSNLLRSVLSLIVYARGSHKNIGCVGTYPLEIGHAHFHDEDEYST